MLNKIFIVILLVSFYSCKKSTDVLDSMSVNTFKYESLEIKIPENYKKDSSTVNRWIDETTGISLNIEVEYSTVKLSEYAKDMIEMVNKFYPDYKIIEKKDLSDKIISILSTATIQKIKLKFYMIIIKLEKSKIILTIGGRENVFTSDVYENFIKLIKVDNEGSK